MRTGGSGAGLSGCAARARARAPWKPCCLAVRGVRVGAAAVVAAGPMRGGGEARPGSPGPMASPPSATEEGVQAGCCQSGEGEQYRNTGTQARRHAGARARGRAGTRARSGCRAAGSMQSAKRCATAAERRRLTSPMNFKNWLMPIPLRLPPIACASKPAPGGRSDHSATSSLRVEALCCRRRFGAAMLTCTSSWNSW
jgi:hypothetical protein